jgi:hypothetical protein
MPKLLRLLRVGDCGFLHLPASRRSCKAALYNRHASASWSSSNAVCFLVGYNRYLKDLCTIQACRKKRSNCKAYEDPIASKCGNRLCGLKAGLKQGRGLPQARCETCLLGHSATFTGHWRTDAGQGRVSLLQRADALLGVKHNPVGKPAPYYTESHSNHIRDTKKTRLKTRLKYRMAQPGFCPRFHPTFSSIRHAGDVSVRVAPELSVTILRNILAHSFHSPVKTALLFLTGQCAIRTACSEE